MHYAVIALMVELTTPLRKDVLNYDSVRTPQELKELRQRETKALLHLQNYKEAFCQKQIVEQLIALVFFTLDPQAELPEDGDKELLPKDSHIQDFQVKVLALLKNLLAIPDPLPGSAGFTP